MNFNDQDRHQSVGAGEAARRGAGYLDACVARRSRFVAAHTGDASVQVPGTPPRRLPRPYGHHYQFWLGKIMIG
jgi:hypothetical protein